MQENCDFDINLTLTIRHKDKREKTVIYLNFDNYKNIDINLEINK